MMAILAGTLLTVACAEQAGTFIDDIQIGFEFCGYEFRGISEQLKAIFVNASGHVMKFLNGDTLTCQEEGTQLILQIFNSGRIDVTITAHR